MVLEKWNQASVFSQIILQPCDAFVIGTHHTLIRTE